MNQAFDPNALTAQPLGDEPQGAFGSTAFARAFDIHHMLATFRRRLKLFLALALLVFVLVLVATLQATPLYTATASVMIDNRTEQVVDTQAVLSGLPADAATVDTEVEVLRSRRLAERVVETLNLDQDPEFNGALRPPGMVQQATNALKELFSAAAPNGAKEPSPLEAQRQREQIVDGVRSRLDIRRVGMTYVMGVSFTSTSPEKAARIANAFAENYLLEQLQAKFEATRQANEWLNTRLGDLRGEVIQAEAAVEQYRNANNLLSASGATLTEQEISTYNQQLATVRATQAEEEARLNTARRQLAGGSTGDDVGEALGSAVVQQLRARRAEVSGRVADLSSRYGPRHPDMLRAERELADIDGQIQAEIGRIVSNLEARVQVSRERTRSMQGSLSGARGALAANNSAGVRLNELQRNAEASRTLYQGLLDRFKQTTSQEGLEESDARVVSRAIIPGGASSPNVPLNLMLGLVVALGAGLAGVILAEMLDAGMTTGEDVENKLGLPHIGSVPLVESIATASERGMAPADYLLAKPLSAFAEAIRALRTSIQFSRVGQTVRVIAVTSTLPGEGKTTTSVCLARSAAQAGQRVVIIDCDLRRRSVNRLIGIEPEVGLLEVLGGSASLEQALHLDAPSGAHVLPLTHTAFTPRDVFNSQAMDQLVETLTANFDLVILDTAPVLAVADTRVLAAKADTVVFLTRWRATPQKAITNSLKLLDKAGAHVAGVALVQVDMRSQARYGYGDAGYYYGAYKSYYTA
ncbi:polysaccharide biosynthesis tyrosine autokinase [Brevundimonas sp. NIBR11]|uniref:GumC family protein n=1 Tax=Brevundimonas sp. NIBR11 TaxID=3015999 RepID=UPI0022F141E0|nr:polysaccharide biosynthesis tyrosine autokinase [Brevundimonas sp. NIBR11]WGM31822.1 Iron-sulfur cluster carrier protein [Brevundimonas sp. NIBR11]